LTAGILLVHLSPNDIAPETYDFVARLNRQSDAYFIAQHGWILAFGNIKGLLRSDTLAGWMSRRAVKAFPVWYLDGTPLLQQLNRYLKSQLRRHQKNRPWRRYGYQRRSGKERLSDKESLAAISKRVASLLHYAVELVPIAERDRLEIYPADFSKALIPLSQRTNWQADRLERWRRQGMLLCGVSSRAVLGLDGLHLRDYAEPAKLLSKFGRYELVTRQKAASPVRDVLTITSDLVDLPAIERRLALYLWERLTPPQTQRILNRSVRAEGRRLYKNSCWWSKKGPRRLFDKAWGSSYRTGSTTAGMRVDSPATARARLEADQKEALRRSRGGGNVIYLNNPAVRHANLKSTRDAYNLSQVSYWNIGGGEGRVAELNKKMKLRRSLNIAPDAIETRKFIMKNIEDAFAVHCDDAEVA
jgi:hypothetical protein